MNSPRLSVIVPAKNQEQYICDALTSLTMQFHDLKDLEVVVVDDGSTDNTVHVVEEFTSVLPRLTLISNPQSLGLATARNQGLDEVQGSYVTFLDADDWLAPGFYERGLEFADSVNVDFVRFDHATVKAGRRAVVKAPAGKRGVVLNPQDHILPTYSSTMVDYPYAWAGLYSRGLVEQGLVHFPAPLHTAEDRPWIWQLFLKSNSYAVFDEVGVLYRRDPSPHSLTQILDYRQLDFAQAFTCAHDIAAPFFVDRPEWETKLALQFLAISVNHINRFTELNPDMLPQVGSAINGALPHFGSQAVSSALSLLGADRKQVLALVVPKIAELS